MKDILEINIDDIIVSNSSNKLKVYNDKNIKSNNKLKAYSNINTESNNKVKLDSDFNINKVKFDSFKDINKNNNIIDKVLDHIIKNVTDNYQDKNNNFFTNLLFELENHDSKINKSVFGKGGFLSIIKDLFCNSQNVEGLDSDKTECSNSLFGIGSINTKQSYGFVTKIDSKLLSILINGVMYVMVQIITIINLLLQYIIGFINVDNLYVLFDIITKIKL